MGAWVSHGCWDAGAHGAFSRWRHELARAAGYRMVQPGPDDWKQGVYFPYVDLHWEAFEPENYLGEWPSPPGDDPLLYLIVHADDEGVIHPAQGRHLADRLEQLLPLVDESAAGGHLASVRGRTQAFIDGLRKAVAADEDVQF